jgi:hypothetical protein
MPLATVFEGRFEGVESDEIGLVRAFDHLLSHL